MAVGAHAGSVDDVQFRQVFPTLPEGEAVNVVDAYRPPGLPSERTTPPRPWVMTNMVTSVDGAVTLAGRSGGLGSDADRAVFRALRSVADVVMAGAGTVRTERYGPVRLDEHLVAARLERGEAATPGLVIVSNSGRLDPDLPLLDPELAADGPLPILLTCAAGEANARHLGAGVEVVIRGDDAVDLTAGLTTLADRGVRTVVCEGGPTLNGALLADGLLDELCLTTSPVIVGGTADRIVVGSDEQTASFALVHLLEAEGTLLARWRRSDPT